MSAVYRFWTPAVIAVGATVTPATVAVTATVPTPTITAASKVTPTAVAVSFAVPTPAPLAASVVTPSVIAVIAAAPGSTITIAPTVQPNVVGATTTIPPPTILAAAVVTPGVVAVVATVPTPQAGVDVSTVTPATVAATVTVPTPFIVSEAGSYSRSRASFVLSRLSSLGSTAEWNAHTSLGGVGIMMFGDDWHTGEDTFSSAQETSLDTAISHAHNNGYQLLMRWMNGNRAPSWPTYGSTLELIIREGDLPGTIPTWDDPEWERVYRQGLARWRVLMEGDCPETSAHTRAEHFHNLTVSLPTESGSEMSAEVGLKTTYIAEGRTLNAGINASVTTIVLDSDPGGSWPTGQMLLDIDNLTEQVQQQSRSGATITLETDGRGWNASTAVSHSSGVNVKRANTGTIFGPFTHLGKSSGFWDEGRTNERIWIAEYGSLVNARIMILAQWRKAIRWHMVEFQNVTRSDGSYLQQSLAGGSVFADGWALADNLIGWVAPLYGNRLTALVTNFEEDYDTQDANAFDWVNRAFKGGATQMMQNRGTGGLPNTLAGLNDLIEAWEDSLQWWPLQVAEVQPSRFDNTDLGTSTSFKGYTGRANDEHSNYLLGANRGSGSDASDNFQDRFPAWDSMGETFEELADETVITASNVAHDVVTKNTHEITADTKEGEQAARFDVLTGVGDCMMRWSSSYPDQRFASHSNEFWFDGYETTVPLRIHRYRYTSGNLAFVRINTSGKLEIFDGTSVLATSFASVSTGQKVRIVSILRAATSGETDTSGLMVVKLWNDLTTATPTESIEAEWSMPSNTVVAVDVGTFGRTGSSDAQTFWVFRDDISSASFFQPILEIAVTPATVAATVAVPTPTIIVAAGVTPGVVAVVATVPTPVLVVPAVGSPATVVTVAAVPTPTVAASSINVVPGVVISVITVPTPSPIITAGVTPATVITVVAVPTPVGRWFYSLKAGYDNARFFRNGAEQFILVTGLSRNAAAGFKTTENWVPASGRFAVPVTFKEQAVSDTQATWVANKAADDATLLALVNTALTAAGFTRPDGSTIS